MFRPPDVTELSHAEATVAQHPIGATRHRPKQSHITEFFGKSTDEFILIFKSAHNSKLFES